LSLEILELFGHASLQGLPTYGVRRFGVPPGGAFDQASHATANKCVGNSQDALTLELAMARIRLRATEDCDIALVGASCAVTISSRVASGIAVPLQKGQEVLIEPPAKHARVYLAIGGGFQKINAPLKAGAILKRTSERATQLIQPQQKSPSLSLVPLRVIPCGASLPKELVSSEFRVSIHSNRMGIRLEGATFDPGEERLSEPACPGLIQVSNDGSLIVLGPDGPTIGGYRKIAVVCSADLDRLAQLRPGGSCRFQYYQ